MCWWQSLLGATENLFYYSEGEYIKRGHDVGVVRDQMLKLEEVKSCHWTHTRWSVEMGCLSDQVSVSGDLLDKNPEGLKLGVEEKKRFVPRLAGCSEGDMKDTEPGVSYTFEPVYTCCALVLCLKCCYCVVQQGDS